MTAVTAIVAAARINLRGVNSENANGAIELSMTASVFGVFTMHTHKATRYQVDHPVEDGESPYRNPER
jgi:hypothetical protein